MVERTQPRRGGGAQFGLLGLVAFMAFALAACSSATDRVAKAAHRSVAGPEVSTVQSAAFGTILVSGGRALYTLAPSATPCDAACTKIWPELLLPGGATAATAGSGVRASSLGTVLRGDGTRQVTYAGQPLYFFAEDTAPGQVKGNITDIWGKWSVVVTAGPANSVGPAPTTTPSTAPPAAGTPATTAPPAPTTTPAPAPTTTVAPATTTTAPAGGGGVGF